jgi:hypothetical protein
MQNEATQVAVAAFACQECERPWAEHTERWRMYVMVAERSETLLYCPACAEREFDAE